MAIKILTVLLVVSCLSYAYGFNPFGAGGLSVDVTDKQFKCDKISCPADTERCVVSTEKDPRNPRILAHTNLCLSRTGSVLEKKTWYESTFKKQKVNVHIDAYRYEGKFTPQVLANNWDAGKIDAGKTAKEDNDAFNRAVEELSKSLDF
ncbi:uncharacterized protein LOC142234557 [Haematobia irritans]|uniref:Putative secreted protein n=1 Tax=Haematobia irritans TaxID=7368 RepID=A0A1L8EJ20_HAEIR